MNNKQNKINKPNKAIAAKFISTIKTPHNKVKKGIVINFKNEIINSSLFNQSKELLAALLRGSSLIECKCTLFIKIKSTALNP